MPADAPFSFAWPWALLLLLPLLIGMWRSRGGHASVAFPSLKLLAGSEKVGRVRWLWVPRGLRCLAAVLLVVAIARPRIQTAYQEQHIEGIAIQLLVDISSSMDMSMPGSQERQTRLEAVKQVLGRFVAGDGDELAGRPNDLLGLVTFARYADTMCPLTTAHDALVEIIDELTIEDRPNEDGTAYGDAVTLAAARFAREGEVGGPLADGGVTSKVIVLLTDGENNCGRHLPLEATALAKQWDVKIYVISMNTPVFDTGEGEVATGPSSAEQILMRMADETGGIYRSVADRDSLESVYREIDALETSQLSTRQHARWAELYAYPTAACLGLLLFAGLLGDTLLRRSP